MKPGMARRWLRRWGSGFLVSVLAGASASAAQSTAGARVLVAGQPGLMVRYALLGASHRLEHTACAQLLTDFQGADGLPLSAHLSVTPVQYLATLWFAEGDNELRCQISGGPIAFTAPGNPVIYVCGRHFVRKYLQNPFYAEAILIHEMLHAAGLGENPPTSEQITRRTLARCAEV